MQKLVKQREITWKPLSMLFTTDISKISSNQPHTSAKKTYDLLAFGYKNFKLWNLSGEGDWHTQKNLASWFSFRLQNFRCNIPISRHSLLASQVTYKISLSRTFVAVHTSKYKYYTKDSSWLQRTQVFILIFIH